MSFSIGFPILFLFFFLLVLALCKAAKSNEIHDQDKSNKINEVDDDTPCT